MRTAGTATVQRKGVFHHATLRQTASKSYASCTALAIWSPFWPPRRRNEKMRLLNQSLAAWPFRSAFLATAGGRPGAHVFDFGLRRSNLSSWHSSASPIVASEAFADHESERRDRLAILRGRPDDMPTAGTATVQWKALLPPFGKRHRSRTRPVRLSRPGAHSGCRRGGMTIAFDFIDHQGRA